MKPIKTLSAILAVAALQLMTSCLGSNNDGYTIKDKYPGLFNAVLDQQTGDITLYSGSSAEIELKYADENTATVQLNGVKLPDGASYPALLLKNLPFKLNSRGWLEVSAKDIEPVGVSSYVSNLMMNDFKLESASRQYNNLTFPPCVVLKYTLNNKYTVYSLPSEIIETGESTITNQDGEQYKPSTAENLTIYYIELDPAAKKGYVVIQGAKFAANMPAMNMKFANIPFDVNAAGNISMQIDELTPALMGSTSDITSAGTPAPNFPITNFRASFIPDYGLQISFNCTPTGKDSQPMGLYSVVFSSIYPTTVDMPK